MRGRRRAITLAALALVLPACSPRHAPTASVDTLTKAVIVALDHPSPDLARAETTLIERCMGKAGFQYPQSVTSQGTLTGSIFGLAGELTLQEARTYGYGPEIKRVSGAQSVSDPVSKYVGTLSATDRSRFEMALVGPESSFTDLRGMDGAVVSVPTKGCVAAARNAIYGSAQGFVSLARVPVNFFRYDDQIQANLAFLMTERAGCLRFLHEECRLLRNGYGVSHQPGTEDFRGITQCAEPRRSERGV